LTLREPRRSASQAGYTRRWNRASTAFRARFPLCGMRPNNLAPVMSECFNDARVTAAALTDHIAPHRGDDALFWDEHNWQSLCRRCHQRKTRAGL